MFLSSGGAGKINLGAREKIGFWMSALRLCHVMESTKDSLLNLMIFCFPFDGFGFCCFNANVIVAALLTDFFVAAFDLARHLVEGGMASTASSFEPSIVVTEGGIVEKVEKRIGLGDWDQRCWD